MSPTPSPEVSGAITALVQGRHQQPHDLLGQHVEDGGMEATHRPDPGDPRDDEDEVAEGAHGDDDSHVLAAEALPELVALGLRDPRVSGIRASLPDNRASLGPFLERNGFTAVDSAGTEAEYRYAPPQS